MALNLGPQGLWDAEAEGIILSERQTVLQSYSKQNSKVLAQTQTHKPMEENREARSKPMHLWLIN